MIVRPAVRAAWLAYTAPLEGVISHFYRCTREKVTIAYGVLVEPLEVALVLPMVRPDGSAASRAEIAAEWQTIKDAPGLGRLGHRAAAPLCRLRLTPEGIEAVTWRRLDDMAAALARRFPDFASYPADAQLAILSLAWACGTSFAYPRCEAAIRRRDWRTAADECAIRSPDLPERSAAQRRHFLAAWRVEAEGLDPAELLDERAALAIASAAREAHALAGWTLDASIDEALARDRHER